jgi:hypothetical protein
MAIIAIVLLFPSGLAGGTSAAVGRLASRGRETG